MLKMEMDILVFDEKCKNPKVGSRMIWYVIGAEFPTVLSSSCLANVVSEKSPKSRNKQQIKRI